MILLIIIIIIILISSAICSMSEAALFSIPINRVRAWVKEELKFATALLEVKESIHKPIATIVILNNISNIVGSIIVGALAGKIFGKTEFGILSGILTLLIIIFSEIIPKTIGERYADSISLLIARPILGLTWFFTPILYVVEWITKPFTKKSTYSSVSEEEIKILAHLGSREGIIEVEEAAIIRKALLLNDIKVKDIMTPRMRMTGFEADQTIEAIQQQLLDSPYSRFPLFNENIDQVIGLLYKNDALAYICQGKGDKPLSELSRKVLFVPENKPIDKLMEELRISQSHTAVVVDEYGGTAGLATLEDILEELVGDIVDETDTDEYEIFPLSEDEIFAHGFTLVQDINEYFDTELENHRTISKLILDKLNRFPEKFEKIEIDNLLFIIEELTPKTIDKVKVKRLIKKEKNRNQFDLFGDENDLSS